MAEKLFLSVNALLDYRRGLRLSRIHTEAFADAVQCAWTRNDEVIFVEVDDLAVVEIRQVLHGYERFAVKRVRLKHFEGISVRPSSLQLSGHVGRHHVIYQREVTLMLSRKMSCVVLILHVRRIPDFDALVFSVGQGLRVNGGVEVFPGQTSE